ncbi:uncharacterized protein LOC107483234 isoform X1 [Arachis duranensis]|uniref:Uncharacterized protein LOC107483234 isoform X1 n=1 Tax=Arachis duranensis TaxID=130453 RepID=A0A9C6WUP2_ARADU|nr:uncharacterized protein LOC107483234 isoform X1 [Arachis duranensis]XP_057720877.1 uncharacterized protein LOC130935249 isoform X2 [Arachis stenosperma]
MEASTSSYKIILGSSSVARRKILSEMGYEFTKMTADIDEKSIRKETPEELVMALAEAKAEAILQKLPVDDYLKDAEPTLLITCDQETETSQIRIPMGLLGRDCRPINQITTST